MRTIHFFRHGQAGLRDCYDALSEVGRRQATALGQYLAASDFQFSRVIVGGLNRQQITAQLVRAEWTAAGRPWPHQVDDAAWNEFDLDGIFREFVPLLRRDDEAFREEWDHVQRQAEDVTSSVHRHWLPCDNTVLQAWLKERYQSQLESWPQFQVRIAQAFAKLAAEDGTGDIAIFTSATPVGLVLSGALGFDPLLALRLAGTAFNSSISRVTVRDGETFVIDYNTTPHLRQAELLTLR